MKRKYTLFLSGAIILTLVLAACSPKAKLPVAADAATTPAPTSEPAPTQAPAGATPSEAPAGQPAITPSPEMIADDQPAATPPAEEEQEADGILSSFTATDLDNNTIDQSIFRDHKLTMVNVWATYCGPCIGEMPDLGELSKEYASKGLRIVGLVSDALDYHGRLDDSQVKTARDIVAQTGADYLHILPSEDFYWLLDEITGVPTTFFVNSRGEQVGMAYIGSMSKAEWADIIDELLTEVA